jgi:hypothetical protein
MNTIRVEKLYRFSRLGISARAQKGRAMLVCLFASMGIFRFKILGRKLMSQRGNTCREHYIPHRKFDDVNGTLFERSPFRVSLTFRKARGFPCDCSYPDMCDSQASPLPPTRKFVLMQEADAPSAAICAEPTAGHNPDPPLQQQARSNNENVVAAPEIHSHSGRASVAGLEASPGGAHTPVAPDDRGCSYREQMRYRGGADGAEQQHVAGAGDDCQQAENGEDRSTAKSRELELEYVHKVYDAIAPHFSATRCEYPDLVRLTHCRS